jgi:hypothetical protein
MNSNSERTFRSDIENAINYHSREQESNTPDFVLAEYLTNCLEAFDRATKQRDIFFGHIPFPRTKPQ